MISDRLYMCVISFTDMIPVKTKNRSFRGDKHSNSFQAQEVMLFVNLKDRSVKGIFIKSHDRFINGNSVRFNLEDSSMGYNLEGSFTISYDVEVTPRWIRHYSLGDVELRKITKRIVKVYFREENTNTWRKPLRRCTMACIEEIDVSGAKVVVEEDGGGKVVER